jgi:putative ABC transport system permease protein
MTWTRRTASLFRHLFRKEKVEAELESELHSYLAMLVDRYVAKGFSPHAAQRAAQMEFEGVEQVKDRVREVRSGCAIETGFQNLRHAWRVLRRNPAFTVIAVLTLALGIGVNTAIFSVVYAELLRPLPYDRPDQLAIVWANFQKMGAPRGPASGPLFSETRKRSRLFQDVGGIWVSNGTFLGDNPEQVKVGFVTANFLSLLGVRPALGRVFFPDDELAAKTTVVLSYGFWKRRFAGDPDIVGKGVPFQGQTATVVGVLPDDFQLYFAADANVPSEIPAYMPFGYDLRQGPPKLHFLRMVGRLKPGVNLAQAQQDMNVVASQIRSAYTPFAEENVGLSVVSLQADAVREIRPALFALFAGAGFVLLICCTNVANLLLARASDGRRDIALRSALGASQRRILGELFAQGLILCGLAVIAGLALGWLGIRWLVRLSPDHLARIRDVSVNWPVLAFACSVSLACVILFGLAPIVELRRWDLFKLLRESRSSRSPGRRRVRSVLIAAEIMLGFVLVIGAGLMIRTLANIHQTRPGFDAQNLLTFEIEFPGSRYGNRNVQMSFIKKWEAAIQSMPGVESVGAISHLPLDDYPNWYSPYRPAEVPEKQANSLLADHRCVTPGYLRAAGTKLLEGRYFDQQDQAGARQVVIVDDMLARAAWPGQSAVGKRLETEHFTSRGVVPVMTEVVGVVEHVRNHSLSRQVRPELYIPFEQSPRSHLSFVVRTRVDPLSLAAGIRRELHNRDPLLALSKLRPMTNFVERATAPASFTARLAAIFAVLALLLASVGIYGVIYYSVTQRTHEMGVRMALGATASDIMRLVMKEGLWLTAAGILLGVAGSVALSHYLRALVYGVSPFDPLTYAVTIAVVPLAAIAGCWRPAAKAARSNPLDAIREA